MKQKTFLYSITECMLYYRRTYINAHFQHDILQCYYAAPVIQYNR